MPDRNKAPSWKRYGMLYEPVMCHPRLKSTEKVVYACISMHCGKGPWTVGQQRLADETGLSCRSVQRCIRMLLSEELIRVLPSTGKTNTYSILTPDSAVAPTGDKDDGTPTTSRSPNPRHGCRVDHKRTLKNQENTSEWRLKNAYSQKRLSKQGH
jgi:hypothetical protein